MLFSTMAYFLACARAREGSGLVDNFWFVYFRVALEAYFLIVRA